MVDRIFTCVVLAGVVLVAAVLAWVLTDVVSEGAARISWTFLVTDPMDAGRVGGIAPVLVSTLWVLVIALAAALPLGLGVAIWLSEFAPKHRGFADYTGITLDILAGIPSIVYGLFGNAFFTVYMGLGYSLLSGGLTLACMILPIFIRTCESGLRLVNDDWRQGAYALGMTRATAVCHILLPATRPAILAGLVLGIGRATAETAALLFTSGYVDRMPDSPLDSGRVLAVHIFDLSMNVTGGDSAAYGSALVLIILIVLLNALAQSLVDNWFKRRTKET